MIVFTIKESTEGRALVSIKDEKNNYVLKSELGETAAMLEWNEDKSEATLALPEGISHIGDFYEDTMTGVVGCIQFFNPKNDINKVTSIRLPETLKYIKSGFFNQFSNLNKIEFPGYSRVEIIYPMAFAYCINLNELAIPRNIDGTDVSIGADAFIGCDNMKRLETPVGSAIWLYCDTPFKGCNSLEELHLRGDAKILTPKFEVRNQLEDSTRFTNVMTYGLSNNPNFVSPLTRIGWDNNFYGENLTSITLPKCVKEIDKDAFNGHSKLRSIEMPDCITSIGERAFLCCYGLQSVKLPQKLFRLGASSFQVCNKLRFVEIPGGVSTIDAQAFADCENLEDVKIGYGVSTIGEGAFFGCGSLKKIKMPSTIRCIKSKAFFLCAELRDVHMPDDVTISDGGVFQYCHPKLRIHRASDKKDLFGQLGDSIQQFAKLLLGKMPRSSVHEAKNVMNNNMKDSRLK